MATLWITEFDRKPVPTDGDAVSQVARLPALTTQTVAIGASSAQSAALNNDTRIVRLYADAACHVLVGSNPTATTSSMPIAAGAAEYFGVTPGQKIAVIQA